ncbi:MAG: glycosyl hydrolase family 25, partial [Eubacterium sp.]
AETPIWICDLSDQTPELKGGHDWILWQYSQRGILKGYNGEERFIDMDLYNGTLYQFKKAFK